MIVSLSLCLWRRTFKLIVHRVNQLPDLKITYDNSNGFGLHLMHDRAVSGCTEYSDPYCQVQVRLESGRLGIENHVRTGTCPTPLPADQSLFAVKSTPELQAGFHNFPLEHNTLRRSLLFHRLNVVRTIVFAFLKPFEIPSSIHYDVC
ncbi:hypothetical protein CPSG_01600 [Coccidioides posadasii str. Silveira]|uniref:Uncharacterized protein n=1 Tax=Coccidioides posadasii (strain RMSCC 757 / Silveira) TaxID=443226 RepID=E9CVW7_COCPS|nr:hypothetical protein CPSG_01600 [Coccidioides posadasii str. Silveira]